MKIHEDQSKIKKKQQEFINLVFTQNFIKYLLLNVIFNTFHWNSILVQNLFVFFLVTWGEIHPVMPAVQFHS